MKQTNKKTETDSQIHRTELVTSEKRSERKGKIGEGD